MPLSYEARRIVDDARAAYGPSDEDRARVCATLPLHLAAAAGAAAAASPGSSAAAVPAGFFAGKGAVLGLTALVVVGSASVGYWWSTSGARGPRAPSAASSPSTPAARTTNQPDSPGSSPSTTEKEQPEGTLRGNRSRSTLAARPISAGAVFSESGPDVAGEIALLNEAQRALASGQADRALQLLDRHAREFPRGSLTEERNAARIIALCALGRTTAARAETAAFVRRTPESPLVERVRAACAK